MCICYFKGMKICLKSYGVIPLKKEGSEWKVLLVQHRNGGHWGFPKGKSEHGETPQESALRELNEETGLRGVRQLYKYPIVERYIPKRARGYIYKKVTYYLYEVEGELALQEAEISDARFLSLEEAEQLATFKQAKRVIKRVGTIFLKQKLS